MDDGSKPAASILGKFCVSGVYLWDFHDFSDIVESVTY